MLLMSKQVQVNGSVRLAVSFRTRTIGAQGEIEEWIAQVSPGGRNSGLKAMAGTTRLEPAASAVAAKD